MSKRKRYGAVSHDAAKVLKTSLRRGGSGSKKFSIDVSVSRQAENPYTMSPQTRGRYVAAACVRGGKSRIATVDLRRATPGERRSYKQHAAAMRRCEFGHGESPTSATRAALKKLGEHLK